ncbi:MAG: glycosyltransferase [Vicinamibacterales bacterium]
MTNPRGSQPVVGYVVKRFPRLSETFILRELLELERLGVDVRVFALGRTDEIVHAEYARLRAPVVYAEDLPTPPPSLEAPASALSGVDAKNLKLARRLTPAIEASGVSHLHAHFATAAAEVASCVGRALSLPCSFTAHAKDIFHESVSAARLESLLREAAFVVTVSDYNVGHLRQVAPGAAGTSIHRIYNGVDVGAFDVADEKGRDDRILGVGRLVEKKGFDVFVDAIARMRTRRPQVSATIVGTGRCEAALREQIDRLGLTSHIALAGARPQAEVLELMRSHRVLAAPCVVGTDGDRDGLPTVIIEAMAVGLPVVSTPVTGIPEIVRHGTTGLIVAEGDAGALAEALETLLTDDRLRTRLSAAARRVIEMGFDTRKNAVALADLFAASAGRQSVRSGLGLAAVGAS